MPNFHGKILEETMTDNIQPIDNERKDLSVKQYGFRSIFSQRQTHRERRVKSENVYKGVRLCCSNVLKIA